MFTQILVLTFVALAILVAVIHWLRRLRYQLREATREEASPHISLARTARLARVPLHARERPPEPTLAALELERPLGESILDEIRHELDEIPPLPDVVTRLLGELGNPRSTAKEVADIASSDPVLGATILKAVNSAYYGIVTEVTSLAQAVSLLGYNSIRTLVVQVGLARILKPGKTETGYRTEDLWVHSLAVAWAAQALADDVGGVDPGFVTTLGLLHDIGKLVINVKFPNRIARIWAREVHEGEGARASYLDRERRVFGADHARVGAYIAHRWGLPKALVAAIHLHHATDSPLARKLPVDARRSLLVVHVANQLAKYCHAYCEDVEVDPVGEATLAELGVKGTLAALLTPKVRRAVSQSIAFVDSLSPRPVAALRDLVGVKSIDEIARMGQIPREWLDDPVLDSIDLGNVSSGDYLDRFTPATVDLSGADWRAFAFQEDVPRDVAIELVTSQDSLANLTALLPRLLEGMGFARGKLIEKQFVIKWLISTARPEGEPHHIRIRLRRGVEADYLELAGEALSFSRHFDVAALRARGGDLASQVIRAILARSLGPLVHRGWFDRIEASEAGDRYLLVRTIRSGEKPSNKPLQ